MLDAGTGEAGVAGCNDIWLDARPPESLAGGFLRFGLASMSRLRVEFFGKAYPYGDGSYPGAPCRVTSEAASRGREKKQVRIHIE